MPNEGPASQRNAGMEGRPRARGLPGTRTDRRNIDLASMFNWISIGAHFKINYTLLRNLLQVLHGTTHVAAGQPRSGKAGTRATETSTESGERGSATRRARLHNGERGSTLEGEAPLRRRARLRSETTTKDGAPRRGERGSTARRKAPQKLESEAPNTTAESEAPTKLRRARLRLQPQKLEGEAPFAKRRARLHSQPKRSIWRARLHAPHPP